MVLIGPVFQIAFVSGLSDFLYLHLNKFPNLGKKLNGGILT